VNIVTKSGSNELHGTTYEFVRNDIFDARNAFAVSRAPFRYNQFGGAASGPVLLPKIYNGRNRSFFFDYEDRQTLSVLASTSMTISIKESTVGAN